VFFDLKNQSKQEISHFGNIPLLACSMGSVD
jgi:hypothetical protein